MIKNIFKNINHKFYSILLHRMIPLLLLSVFTAYSLMADLSVADLPDSGINSSIYKLFYKLTETFSQELSDQALLFTILSCFFGFLYLKVWQEKKRVPLPFSGVLSLFLSLGYVAGLAYSSANTITYLFDSDLRLIKSGIFFLGIFMLYLTIINLFYHLCKSNLWNPGKNMPKSLENRGNSGNHSGRFSFIFQTHSWKFFFLLILVSWIPHLLFRYPGAMSYDNYNQLSYYFGLIPYTTAQPVFHTWLFGSFVNLGLSFGSENMGLFLFVLFQSAIMAVVLALTLKKMAEQQVPRHFLTGCLVLYCFGPYFCGYAAFPIKDYLYTAGFVLFFLILTEVREKKERGFLKKGTALLWILSSLFMILSRNNGIYIYLPAALILGCSFLKKRKTYSAKQNLFLFLLLAAPLFCNSSIQLILTSNYQVVKDSPKEMFSLPFQQTARFAREHQEEISPEDAAVIGQVLDYENLPTLYNEMTSDPVKTTYHASSGKELSAYFRVWLNQFFQDPLCYLEATWNQNYYLFYPKTDNLVFNRDCYVGQEITIEYGLPAVMQFEVPKLLQGLPTVMVSWYTLLSKLPVLGLLSNVSFYVISFFVLSFFILIEKKRSLYLPLLPLLLTFFFVIIGPQIYQQPRYAFPIVYSLPLLLGLFLAEREER